MLLSDFKLLDIHPSKQRTILLMLHRHEQESALFSKSRNARESIIRLRLNSKGVFFLNILEKMTLSPEDEKKGKINTIFKGKKKKGTKAKEDTQCKEPFDFRFVASDENGY